MKKLQKPNNLTNPNNPTQNTRGMMSEAKFFESYSRFIDSENRYETWDESIERVMQMHRIFYKDKMTDKLSGMLFEVQDAYKDKLFLGAQRALQFGGDQLLKHHSRLYNCASTHCDRPEAFSETMYLLLSGAGVGFSVQKQHIAKLPQITLPLLRILKMKDDHMLRLMI